MTDLPQATLTITPPDWMRFPETIRLFDALNEEGAEEKGDFRALFVGGCVRNAVLGRSVSDIDLCTLYTPDQVISRLKAASIKTVPTGIDHGTVTAVIGSKTFEITTLRQDIRTDGRHAEIAFTASWLEDAKRRDFTMNSLLADHEGRIYDPLGCGIEDAIAGRVIFVGDPDQRIREDYLRIWRFFRFFGQYGSGELDQTGLNACAANLDGLNRLSKERVTAEFLKILAADKPSDVLEKMAEIGIDLAQGDFNALRQISENQKKHNGINTLSRLVILNYEVAEQLALSNKQQNFIKNFSAALKKYPPSGLRQSPSLMYYVKLISYEYGKDIAWQWVLSFDKPEDHLLDWLDRNDPPIFPLQGKDLIAIGYTPGPDIGAKLKELEQQWIASDFDDHVVSYSGKKCPQDF